MENNTKNNLEWTFREYPATKIIYDDLMKKYLENEMSIEDIILECSIQNYKANCNYSHRLYVEFEEYKKQNLTIEYNSIMLYLSTIYNTKDFIRLDLMKKLYSIAEKIGIDTKKNITKYYNNNYQISSFFIHNPIIFDEFNKYIEDNNETNIFNSIKIISIIDNQCSIEYLINIELPDQEKDYAERIFRSKFPSFIMKIDE
jgi:hypothetical protein